MKKLMMMSLAFLGLSMGSLSAQTCCSTSTAKDCKPKICCPSQTSCCTSTDKVKANVAAEKSPVKVTASIGSSTSAVARRTEQVAIKKN